MKFMIALLLLFSTCNAVHTKVDIGFYVDENDSSKKYLTMVLRVMETLFNNHSIERKIPIKLNIKLYEDKDKLYENYYNGKLTVIILPPYLYVKNKKTLDKNSIDIWQLERNNEAQEEYYLIAHKKLKNPLKNIHNHKVSIFSGNNVARYWFKTVMYQKFEQSFKKTIPNLSLVTKESKIVYDVFFNKNNLGVISKSSFELLSELNPQIKKDIAIIEKSKKMFVSLLGFTNKNTAPDILLQLNRIIKNIELFLDNSQLSSDATVTSMEQLTKSEINKIEDFFMEFYKLEEKYEVLK